MAVSLRLLLILTVLVQQLSLPAVLLGTGADGCTATGCCDVVQTTTCCGEVVEEMRCRKSGGACLCATSSHEPTTPALPGPQDRGDLVSLFITPVTGPVLEPLASRDLVRPASATIRRSHAETRSLLCIWRT